MPKITTAILNYLKILQIQKLLLLLQSVPYYKDTRHIAQSLSESPPQQSKEHNNSYWEHF